MQTKGIIKFFAIILAVACLYELSFTFLVRYHENKAKDNAAGNDEKEVAYIDSIGNLSIYPLLGFTFDECKEKELNLGLDLKGGMNVTLEIEVADIIKAMSDYSTDTTFNLALDRAKEMQKKSEEDFVTLFGLAYTQVDPNAQLAAVFGVVRDNSSKIPLSATNEEVLQVIRDEADAAIKRAFQVLRTRIDRFGVTQPSIQRIGNTGRILIELPGVKDPARVRKLLQGTARLEFWHTFENAEVYGHLEEVNKRLRLILEKEEKEYSDEDTSAVTEPTLPFDKESNTDIDTVEAEEGFSFIDGDSTQTDSSGLLQNNPLFKLLNPNIRQTQDGKYQLGRGPVVGFALVTDTAEVNSYFRKEEISKILPRNLKLLWNVKPQENQDGRGVLELIAIKTNGRDNKPPLDGGSVADARQDFGAGGENEVTMTMNAEGTSIWKKMTADAVEDPNNKRSVAIVLDNFVYSSPVVENEIPNGRTSIHGNFTLNEATDLANVLKSGKLPAKAHIVEEAIVGPSLGQEAISAGFWSFVIAIVVVLLYMVFYYSQAGWVANIALAINIFFIIGVLASLGAVLTLSGILGIVLTVGMSVDANVLIFERIREELRDGKGVRLAINDGFSRAYSAIIDANITTLVVGVILYIFGKGTIQGFATTLIIGILTSLFSALFISRVIFLWLLEKNKPINFISKATEKAFSDTHIAFVEKRKAYYALSTILIVGGLVSFALRGFSYGVDFTGGRTYTVRFEQEVGTSDISSKLKGSFEESPEVKTFGSLNQVKVTTNFMIDNEANNADNVVMAKLTEGLGDNWGKFEIMSSQKVGPTIADDIKRAAWFAIGFSLLAMFLYIALRFKKWQFGVGALAALFHDVLIVLGCFSLFHDILPFSLEIDKAFIAAILTVIGYSINDTVVIFDRIREFSARYKREGSEKVFNMALNSTLGRTFNTSITVIFVLLSSFILGGDSIRGFAFALLIGVVVGTYSSVCIATPLVIDLTKKKVEEK